MNNLTSKLTRVEPTAAQKPPYIRGTQPGHFYLVIDETPAGVIGFRPLDRPFAAIGDVPTNGQQTRVRCVLTNPNNVLATKELFGRLGFDHHLYSGETEAHFSIVTTTPLTAINDCRMILNTITGLASWTGQNTGLQQQVA